MLCRFAETEVCYSELKVKLSKNKYIFQRVLHEGRGGDLHQDRLTERNVCTGTQHRFHRPLPRPEEVEAGPVQTPMGRHQLRLARDEPVEVEIVSVL